MIDAFVFFGRKIRLEEPGKKLEMLGVLADRFLTFGDFDAMDVFVFGIAFENRFVNHVPLDVLGDPFGFQKRSDISLIDRRALSEWSVKIHGGSHFIFRDFYFGPTALGGKRGFIMYWIDLFHDSYQ
jgi:hypothetical protein